MLQRSLLPWIYISSLSLQLKQPQISQSTQQNHSLKCKSHRQTKTVKVLSITVCPPPLSFFVSDFLRKKRLQSINQEKSKPPGHHDLINQSRKTETLQLNHRDSSNACLPIPARPQSPGKHHESTCPRSLALLPHAIFFRFYILLLHGMAKTMQNDFVIQKLVYEENSRSFSIPNGLQDYVRCVIDKK